MVLILLLVALLIDLGIAFILQIVLGALGVSLSLGICFLIVLLTSIFLSWCK